MECNKEEAEKCKAISEASLKKLDLAAARRFALKAKQLFPELDGLAQLTSILDVYVAAHEKLCNGESNWYAILQVDFRADENTIRKQYRKLALFLHPDKNKAFGAEAAFKNISEAWSVLSDGKKKSDYDKRWFAHMAAQRRRSPSTTHNSPGFRARENISKQHMHGARQPQRHVHQGQLHRQAQQGQSQGSGKVHAQVQGQSSAHAQQQHEQNHQYQGNRQGQVQAHAHQQQSQRQGTAHADQQQRHGQAYFQQQGQTHVSQQQQDGQQTHAPEQVKARENQHHQQQGQVHAHQKQWQGQSHAHLQEGQDQAHTHRQQEQQGQACVLQGKEHVQQQGQCQDHDHQQRGEGQAQGQGHAHIQQLGRGEGHVSQQGQAQAPGPQQGQHRQQGQGEACVQQQQQLQHETQSTELNRAHFSKSPFVHEKSTFWTACPCCKMQLEYNRAYMNKKLCCPMCYRPFVSKEIEPIQGDIVWPCPKQQHKEALEKDVGNTTCQVEEFDCIPEVDSNMPEIVHPEEKTKRGKKVNFSQQKFQHSSRATICAEERTVKQKQEQKKKLHVQRKFEIQTNYVERLLDSMKEVINQECSKEQGNPGADKASTRMGRGNAANRVSTSMSFVQNFPAAYACNPRVRTQKAIGSRGLGGSSANMNSAAPYQAPAYRPTEQSIQATAKKKAFVSNMEKKLSNADECKRTRISSRKEFGGPPVNMKAPVSTLFEQTIPAALDQTVVVGNMEGNTNVDDDSNVRVWTPPSAGPKESGGSHKGSCLNDLGSSKMEKSQHKRKCVSTIDQLGDSGTMKRRRQSSSQGESVLEFEKRSEDHQPLNHSKSSKKSSLQVHGDDNLPVECEMEVPDSDFYNFDGDRTEKHFAVGQVWATYDDDDGMPRYYTRVNKILSLQPLKMQMNWLEARTPTHETLAWLNAGFQHTCGDFWLGSVYTADQVSTFSHLVMVEKMSKDAYKIYPRRGDVWAVYKEWELLKVRDDNRGYEMVKIMATFDGKRGVQVAPLFKVAGFKTIFERKPGEEYMKWIPLHEIRRFSHQVPAHPIAAGKVPGIEVEGLEIDPASTPMNLITGEQ